MDRPLNEPSSDWGTVPIAQALRRESLRQDTSRVAVAPPAPAQVPLGSQRLDGGNGEEWVSFSWAPERDRQTRQPRRAGFGAFARRLMALERARMRRRTSTNSMWRR